MTVLAQSVMFCDCTGTKCYVTVTTGTERYVTVTTGTKRFVTVTVPAHSVVLP